MTRRPDDPPNLITASGRESMSLDDRIALLDADVTQLTAGNLNPNWRRESGETFTEWSRQDWYDGAGSRAHAFNSLVGWLRGFVHMHEKHMGFRLDALSRAECLLLAWRRGGFNEWRAVKAEQASRERDAREARRSAR